MKNGKNFFPIFFLFLIVCLFFWKTILNDLIPFPGDMLVGAYYPWLDYKWGTVTGVPIKNPYITDIFSQIYLWKQLISDSFKNGYFPLWNIYSYSGYPLLANFQSGAFNIFNSLFIIFGMVNGWSLFMICGILFSVVSMFFYLKIIKKNNFASIIGSIIYGFSGFSILWMPYANADYSLAILPLILLLIEKFIKTSKIFFLFLISPCLFFLVAAGHLQILFYGSFLIFCYFLFRLSKKVLKFNLYFFKLLIPFVLGVGLSAIQLLPTFELSNLSIRFDENFIEKNNFGLSPIYKLITLFAPDFFGNPSTYNYWGFFNYHETCFYVGIVGLIALIWSILNFKKLKSEKFFLFAALLALFLGFDTFVVRFLYKLNFFGISTSAAGRIASIFTLSIAVLSANFIDKIQKINLKNLIKPISILFSLSVLVLLIIFFLPKYNPSLNNIFHIAQRNMIFPFLLLFSLSFCLIFINKKIKIFYLFLILLTIFDFFRFGWKVTPFVKKDYVFPKTQLTDFLEKDKDIFRIDRDNGPIMPPNTWTAYGLMSPSGYDPLAVKNYCVAYNISLNQNKIDDFAVSRYSELKYFDSKALGDFNVKYLMLTKKDNIKFPYVKNFDENSWLKVYETSHIALFKNPNFKPRVEIISDEKSKSSSAKIISYLPNYIKIEVNNASKNSELLLRDTFYPGWKAYINNKEVIIDKYNSIYRIIKIPKNDSVVEFKYISKSFEMGKLITLVSLFIWFFSLPFILFKN